MNLSERYRKARTGVVIGIFGNLFLSLLKLAAGILGNSLAVIADSVHSLSDMLTSVVVWIGIRVGKKYPDKEHPYGHGDAEPIAGLIVSIALGIIGFELIRNSVVEILTGRGYTPGTIAIIVVVFSIVFKYWMTFFVMKIGKETRSPALIADAYHHKSDFYTSIAVLIGVAGARMGFSVLDPLASILVSLWIIKIGFDLGRRNIRSLMGEVPSDEMLSGIKSITSGIKGVKNVHSIKVHYVGPHAFVTMHVNIDKKTRLSEAHEIATKVEDELKKKIEPVSYVTVHPEPA
ncbi:MAG: cation transporter [Candidatus Aenigmatarchaeota archaeon]|nr:MAG: cation transporter [Candidatus Aenigmarchaeota archaeon]